MLCGVTATLGSNPSATATAARPHWGRAVLLCLAGVPCGCVAVWPHGCSGRRRPRPPARLGDLTAFGAAPRSPPVPSGPSGALHTSGARPLIGASPRSPARPRHRPRAPQPGPPIPAAPSTPAAPTLLRCGLVRRLEARPGLASRSTLYPQFRMQFPNACSLQLCEKPGISTITFQSMKYARGNCMRNLSGAGPAAAFGCWGRTLRPFRRSSSQRRWGFCSIRSWLSACRRRVVSLMTPFPPFGGSVSVAGGWSGARSTDRLGEKRSKRAVVGEVVCVLGTTVFGRGCVFASEAPIPSMKPLWRASTRYLECGWGVDARKPALLGLVVGVSVKKFAMHGLLVATAVESSPCAGKTRQIGPFWASRASFVPHMR